MPTMAAIERRFKEADPSLSRSTIRKAAKLYHRRHATFTRIPTHDEALLLVKAINYRDDTGDIATGLKRPL